MQVQHQSGFQCILHTNPCESNFFTKNRTSLPVDEQNMR